jgi:hypothetical protein
MEELTLSFIVMITVEGTKPFNEAAPFGRLLIRCYAKSIFFSFSFQSRLIGLQFKSLSKARDQVSGSVR